MNEIEEQVISLSEIFEALKKRWIMIVAITKKLISPDINVAVNVIATIIIQRFFKASKISDILITCSSISFIISYTP